ncbi:hypothetical protein DSM104443_03045 [Usitatibacter rugosus]|uniref:Polyketide cyclase/dehydrase/lipid transport protein n=1 Tax=Usitatibacter rugosus TaxID=2732067 RepID=A0A6M4GY69_9PROT|nr:SRPBCC family protein [Usitatibacter rugosus]QJR11962.1 hypothetical protein DSM104443_03045 [Usitatibacter rugosus]
MKVVKWIAIVVGVLVAVFFVGAALMPSGYNVQRSVVINAPAEKIYPLIAAPKEWPKWAIWFKREHDMKLTFAGAESGAGAKWAWKAKEGSGEMEFTKAEPNKSIDYVLAFPEMGMASKGAITLTPEGPGTRVKWTNEGDVGKNPMMRWFVPFLDRMIGGDYEAGLADLKILVEKQA